LSSQSTSSAGLRAWAAVAGIAVLGAGATATPANAKPAATTQASNCVVALAKGVNNILATTCFTTFTEAISYATHGAVKDAPATATLAGKDGDLAAKINAAATAKDVSAQGGIIGIEYDELNYTNSGAWSVIFTGTANCTGPINDIDYQFPLPPAAWDKISSFRTFFSPTFCWADHYYLQNFGLPRTGYYSSRSPVPTMNIGGGPFNGDNNTRSIRWS
jgi:hypothetical protein